MTRPVIAGLLIACCAACSVGTFITPGWRDRPTAPRPTPIPSVPQILRLRDAQAVRRESLNRMVDSFSTRDTDGRCCLSDDEVAQLKAQIQHSGELLRTVTGRQEDLAIILDNARILDGIGTDLERCGVGE